MSMINSFKIKKKKMNRINVYKLDPILNVYLEDIYLNPDKVACFYKNEHYLHLYRTDSSDRYIISLHDFVELMGCEGEINRNDKIIYKWRNSQPEEKIVKWLHTIKNNGTNILSVEQPFCMHAYSEELDTLLSLMLDNREDILNINREYQQTTVVFKNNSKIKISHDECLYPNSTIFLKMVSLVSVIDSYGVEQFSFFNKSPTVLTMLRLKDFIFLDTKKVAI